MFLTVEKTCNKAIGHRLVCNGRAVVDTDDGPRCNNHAPAFDWDVAKDLRDPRREFLKTTDIFRNLAKQPHDLNFLFHLPTPMLAWFLGRLRVMREIAELELSKRNALNPPKN